MSSFPIRATEKERKSDERQLEAENQEEDEDEESSAAESEEADQLLLSYRKNSSSKKRVPSARRPEPDSNSIADLGRGDDASNMENFPEDGSNEKSASSPEENWFSNESLYSSESLLRDLLPHLTETNANANAVSTISTLPSCQTSFLTKTYTEPNSLSGLLRQVGNRLLVHYPSRVVKRHSKISPATSIHCKLDDVASSSQSTVLTAALASSAEDSPQTTPCQESANETSLSRIDSPGKLECLDNQLLVSQDLDYQSLENQHLGNQSLDRHRKRLPVKTPLCKRCPHCRKTFVLRKNVVDNVSSPIRNASPNLCSCRICMILENVESNLSNSFNVDLTDAKPAPTSSTTTINLSEFDESQLGPRHVSLGGVSLEFGLFCDECNNSTVQCEKSQNLKSADIQSCYPQVVQQVPAQLKSREQGIQVNSSSMVSIATTSSFGGPVCRICHSPGDKLEPLISPCRCLGTLKYVHAACLLHWLDISSRKLRRPPHCELCGYRYQRHKSMKLRRIQWPTCSRRDKMYHALFIFSVLMMIACAAVTIVCFKADRNQVRSSDDGGAVIKKATGGGAAAVSTSANGHVELTGQEVVTLVCGILFFCAFFLAMYVQVKAQTTVYKLFVRFWSLNQEWRVDEYRKEKDAEYCRQRQEQQLQLQQQQRRSSSSNSTGAGNVHQPLIFHPVPRQSLTFSDSSSTSFHGDTISGID